MSFLIPFQEGPAETTVYMIAGYTIVFVVIALYIASLWLRWRNLQRDQSMLDDLLSKGQSSLEIMMEERNV